VATKLGARFDRLSIAAGVSNIGDGVSGAAFPLLVASLTRDPLLVAAATLIGRLPWLLFALISGALVDRMDRKRVMVITNVLRALGIGLMAWGVATDRVELFAIYVVAFGLGVAETFFDTSAEALVPRLVDIDDLPPANGRLQALEWVGGAFAGPPLGALLFAVFAALPFFVDAASFAIAAFFILLIPGSYRSERVIDTSVREDIAGGLKWLWNQRVVRTLALMAGVTNLFTFGIIAVFVLYAQDILGVSDVGYGVLLATLGVGGLLGAFVGPRLVLSLGSGNTIRLTLVAQIVLTALFGFTSNVYVVGALLLFYGLLITAWNIVAVSLRQGLTPDEIRGRVAGASRLLAWGAQPLGALLGGLVASAFGLRAPFFVASVAFVIATALVWSIISNETIEDARAQTPAG
jgi:MFS family permease